MPSNADKYREFSTEQVKRLGCAEYDPDLLLWHYTDAPGLIGIVESGTLYCTQVSCVNDSTEVLYALGLFKAALTDVLAKQETKERVSTFVTRYLKLMEGDSQTPSHAPSKFFVTCFSLETDDLTQWRSYCGGENGYAVAFKAKNLWGANNSGLLKVNYDKALHEQVARTVADATVRFYEDGLSGKDDDALARWDDEFLAEWDAAISYLAPIVKDPGFKSENEYRIIHDFSGDDLMNVIVRQKKSMMTRHVPLHFPHGGEAWVPRLPIENVMVGPCRHPGITRISVDTLLRKMGYGTGKVAQSARPFQET